MVLWLDTPCYLKSSNGQWKVLSALNPNTHKHIDKTSLCIKGLRRSVAALSDVAHGEKESKLAYWSSSTPIRGSSRKGDVVLTKSNYASPDNNFKWTDENVWILDLCKSYRLKLIGKSPKAPERRPPTPCLEVVLSYDFDLQMKMTFFVLQLVKITVTRSWLCLKAHLLTGAPRVQPGPARYRSLSDKPEWQQVGKHSAV